jgi:hypothetical protein
MNTDLDNSSSIEKHTIQFENLSINRLILNEKNSIDLFSCSPFIISINRYLHSEDNNQISIEIQWDNIDFKLGNSDYASINQIFQQNFQEKFFNKIPQIENNVKQDKEQEYYSSNNITKKQSSTDKISPKIQLDFQIKQISLTLYLDQTNIQLSRNQNSKFIYLTIQMIQALFQQSTNSTYYGKLQIQHLFADDCRLNKQFSQLINKGFKVDQNAPLLTATLNYKTSIRTGKLVFILTYSTNRMIPQQINHLQRDNFKSVFLCISDLV